MGEGIFFGGEGSFKGGDIEVFFEGGKVLGGKVQSPESRVQGPVQLLGYAEEKSLRFNVDKLISEGQVYRRKETEDLPLHGNVMVYD